MPIGAFILHNSNLIHLSEGISPKRIGEGEKQDEVDLANWLIVASGVVVSACEQFLSSMFDFLSRLKHSQIS